MELEQAYRGKKVLVTGHTGFKGGWLTLWLQELGADVIGLGLAPDTEPSLFEAANVSGSCKSVIADVRDKERILKIVQEERPEHVFHLAAQPLVRRSYRDPVGTFETNVIGTANVLDAIRTVGSVRSCVIVTSDKCYENLEWTHAYRESDPMGGHDPYSASKGAAELVVSSFRRSFFNDSSCGLATARAGNVIGGGDWAEDRIVPDCIRALSNGEKVKVRNPYAVRPWQHVLEPLYGYLLLGMKLHDDPKQYSEAWNFGPMVSKYTVGQLVDDVVQAWGSGGWEDVSEKNAVHEANCLRLDSTKANIRLGWAPRLDVRQGVALTVAWYKRHQAKADMREFTQRQIAAYSHSPSKF
ncbi:MAG: dTDP-glucose 4,6-dehydratase [Methanomassiliicoccales archaeon PtaU1.Bin124]|nr:MAG: dTDP-glucose 4,6-dehydratase [Methanomassiliicoccales archaeon PtaU1.Bin124]